jgi:putative chitinase
MTVNLDIEQLGKIAPSAKSEDIAFYLETLNQQLEEFNINTPLRVAHFVAQIAHESGGFRYKSENLNYSAKALRAVFSKYFAPKTDKDAELYARQPEKIANRVYANRMGNGDEQSGDGWKYRGRGLIQLTGFDNYQQCSDAIGKDLVSNPDLLAESAEMAVAAACWFWNKRKLNDYADQDDLKQITKKINGGYHGLDDRAEHLARAKDVLDID